MRMATAVHHTNPRSATLDFWRKTTRYEDYKLIQAKRRAQMNKPTSSGLNKEDHMVKGYVIFFYGIKNTSISGWNLEFTKTGNSTEVVPENKNKLY